ncbi:MAG: hypothetical protein LBH00_02410 [Planctomycetaceae bacterium]|nr:hypothetical protein [Planctomycetaceae bacterium]
MPQDQTPASNGEPDYGSEISPSAGIDPVDAAPVQQPNYPPQEYGNTNINGYASAPEQPYTGGAVPMIDPVESAKLTPQILLLLVLSGLKRHWKWTVPLGLICGFLAAGAVFFMFPLQYEAKTMLRIRFTQQNLIFSSSDGSGYEDFVGTQIATMRSPFVLAPVLLEPDIKDLPCVKREIDSLSWLTKKLRVSREKRAEFVNVSIETNDADASKTLLTSVVRIYLAQTADISQANSEKILQVLHTEKQKYMTEAQRMQQYIQTESQKAAGAGAVRSENGLVGGLGQGESLAKEIAMNDADLIVKEARRAALAERVRSPGKIRIPDTVLQAIANSDPVLKEKKTLLAALKQQKSEWELVMSKNDPRMQELNKKIKELADQLENPDKKTSDGGKQPASEGLSAEASVMHSLKMQWEYELYTLDLDINDKKILSDELKKKQKEMLTSASQSAGMSEDIAFKKAELNRLHKVLDVISERIAALTAEKQAPDRITQQLVSPVVITPNKMRQIMMMGMGGAAMAFLPLCFGVVIERMKPRLYHASQVRRAAPRALVGEIMEPPVAWIHGSAFQKRLARYRESVHNWCTHLLLSDPFRHCRTLSVASVAGDDGKTFLAVQIAVAMAQMKRDPVLLIDGDMRVGRLHLLFGNEEAGVGLADVLSLRARWGESVVMNEKEPNLHLLSAGQLDVSPYELLGSGDFRELLDAMQTRYSLILVVLPPAANAAESLIMSASTDSTLLCVRQGETVLAAMEDVYRMLVNTGSSVDGIVVKDIPYYQMAGRDGGFADKLEQIRLSHLLQYAN